MLNKIFILTFCYIISIAVCLKNGSLPMNQSVKNVNIIVNQDMIQKNMSHYILSSPRRVVLIINDENILRSKSKKVKSLCYEEYDKDGKLVNRVMMYNMEDVANFIKTYLNPEICYGKCET